MMRNKIGILLLCIVLALMTVSCKKAEEGKQLERPNTAGATDTYDLRILAMVSANKVNTYNHIVNAFLEEYPYYTIDLDVVYTEAAARDAAVKSDYDILFLESVQTAKKLYEAKRLCDISKLQKQINIKKKISNLFASKWEFEYAVPLFLKIDCNFSDQSGESTEPIDYIARVVDKESKLLNTLTCTGFPTEKNGVVPIDCTCVCVGNVKDRTNAELFLTTLFENDFLSSCVRTIGIPLACRVSLSNINLYKVTESVYQQLADPKVILRYQNR